ncbi:hypothetical protein C1645_870385 [Glomus cerebriforme]|uniref:Uncharacterized protein n=1 Tax=Glomus cerebriforme TaxID=658196 RepID=A0A397TMW7_9GLOM|nr:hypothetical protein C1645_870385 [Glomus cerebriforme]
MAIFKIINFGKTKDSFIFSFKGKDNIENHILSRVKNEEMAIVCWSECGPFFSLDLTLMGDYNSCKLQHYEKLIRETEDEFFLEEYEPLKTIKIKCLETITEFVYSNELFIKDLFEEKEPPPEHKNAKTHNKKSQNLAPQDWRFQYNLWHHSEPEKATGEAQTEDIVLDDINYDCNCWRNNSKATAASLKMERYALNATARAEKEFQAIKLTDDEWDKIEEI